MRTRILILLSLITVLMSLASGVLAQPNRELASVMYPGQPGSAAGGMYHLEGSAWHAGGVSTGGRYLLSGPAGPTLTGSGCCCLYLPCLQRTDH